VTYWCCGGPNAFSNPPFDPRGDRLGPQTILHQALIVNAIAAPLIFVAVSWVYFCWFGTTSPLMTAVTFTAAVILLDALIIAPVVERGFAMFRSILGTWLPFALIFLATWATGLFMAHPN
jgi:hypothetical protein